MKLPKLWKASKGPDASWLVYWKRKKVNLHTSDAREAERRRRDLVKGVATAATFKALAEAEHPTLDETLPESPAAALQAAFEAEEAPPAPQNPSEAPAEPLGGAGSPPPAPEGQTVKPDAYQDARGWTADLSEAAGATDQAQQEAAAEGVEFDTAELLDFAAEALAGGTEAVARKVLAKRNRAAPEVGNNFPLKVLLKRSWAAQLTIWLPADTQVGPGTGIIVGTLGLWVVLAMSSVAVDENGQPVKPQESAAA